MKNRYMSTAALEAALRAVGLEDREVEAAALERQGEFYYVSLCSLFLSYEIYVDEKLCVRGINTEPVSQWVKNCPVVRRAA